MILAGFSAYSRNLDWKRFKEIADEVGAITMADISHVAGLIAGKAIDSPVLILISSPPLHIKHFVALVVPLSCVK